jgi:uncharacterized protein (TIGR03435 family)
MKPFCRFAFLISAALLTISATIQPGTKAPEIHFDRLFPEQPMTNASLAALAGKAVVLEFWTTSCGPCIEAFPHWNRLVDKFKDRPVAFISLTYEDPAVIEPFLQKHSIHGIVGAAHTENAFKAYGVEGFPTTILVDASGKVAAVTNPNFLTESVIEDLLAGRPLALRALPNMASLMVKREGAESGPTPLLDMLIRPASGKEGSGGSFGSTSLSLKNSTLGSLLSNLYSLPPSRIDGVRLESETRYDFSFAMPKADRAAFQAMTRQVVMAYFQLQARRENRETDVWVLAKLDERPAGITETDEPQGIGSKFGKGDVQLKAMTIRSLASMLEKPIGRPVFDETGLTAKYDVNLTFDADNPQTLVDALRKLGFRVEPARRSIEFLVVTKAE